MDYLNLGKNEKGKKIETQKIHADHSSEGYSANVFLFPA
jgi:hypothetical protein